MSAKPEQFRPATTAPPMPERGSTRERILAAAKELFLERGYPDTSMDLIARRAGIVRATVYNNFVDKSAILDALMRSYLDGYVAIPGRLREQARPEQSSFELIEAMIREAIEWRLANADLRPLIDISEHLPNSGWSEANAAADDAMRDWILEVHRRDADRGLLRNGFDIDFATTALYGMVEAVLSSFDVKTTRRRVDQAVYQLALLHWHALYVSDPETGRDAD